MNIYYNNNALFFAITACMKYETHGYDDKYVWIWFWGSFLKVVGL